MPQASARIRRFVLWLLFFAGLVIYLLGFRAQVERNPLRADEIDFYRCMQNVVVLGRPLYYAGQVNLPATLLQPLGSETLDGRIFQFYRFKPETRILKETFFALTDGNSRYTYCLWHPPLYVYLGALFLRVFDLRPADANLFRYAHLVFVTLMLGGIALLMRELYKPVWLLGLALATLFLAVSNLSMAASVLVDYNGALAMSVVIWLAWAFVHADRDPRYLPSVAILIALSFGVGLGVGAIAMLALLLWTFIFHRAALLRHALATIGGLALFLVAFWLFSRLAHFPFSQPFLHNFQRAALQTPLLSRLAAVLKYFRWYLEQIGVVAIVVALILAVWRVLRPAILQETGSDPDERDPLQVRRRLLAPTFVLAALLSQASLSADAWGFPKYIAFALPLLSAFVGGEIADLALNHHRRWLAVTFSSLIVISLALPVAQSFQRPGGTLYMAGEQGFLQAAQVLAANSIPPETFLGSKDLSFYSGRNFVQWSGPLLTDSAQLRERVRAEGIQLAAASKGQLATASQDVAAWLAEHGTLIAEPGDYRIYRLR